MPAAKFVAPRGKLLCWKCGGNGTHETCKRDDNGYPIGFIAWETCRHCDGEGLVEDKPKPVEPPVEQHIGWGNYHA